MKIIHIFRPKNNPEAGEGLWSIEYESEASNEYEKLLALWRDPEYMYAFCAEHLADVQQKFGYTIDPETAANELMDEAEALLKYLVYLATKRSPGVRLQQVFKPLNNFETTITELQLSKGVMDKKSWKNPKLRLYAVRVGENTYVFTGGAIKLTDLMEERLHTRNQLTNVKKVRDWLKREGLYYPEDLTNVP